MSSTVHFDTEGIFGQPFPQCVVIFTPLDAPFTIGVNLVLAGPRSFALDGAGEGSVTVLGGNYTVAFQGTGADTNVFTVVVPSSGIYEFTSLVTSGFVTPVPASATIVNGIVFGLTGLIGGANKLDGLPVTAETAGALWYVQDAAYGGLRLWLAVLGVATMSDPANGVVVATNHALSGINWISQS